MMERVSKAKQPFRHYVDRNGMVVLRDADGELLASFPNTFAARLMLRVLDVIARLRARLRDLEAHDAAEE